MSITVMDESENPALEIHGPALIQPAGRNKKALAFSILQQV
jgi:hypothetical protein